MREANLPLNGGGRVTESRQVHGLEARLAADEVVSNLKAALQNHGIKLPSLWGDTMLTDSGSMVPMIELGGCNYETARKLLDVLQRRNA